MRTTEINYQGKSYHLPTELCGGTAAAPLLKPADELLLDRWREWGGGAVTVLHDLTGALSVVTAGQLTGVVEDNYARELRVRNLYERNDLGDSTQFRGLLEGGEAAAIALLRVPKSLATFDLYLRWVAASAGAATRLAASFMTRHFSPALLDIAGRYAETVDQSRAYKKARLLLLGGFRREGAGAQVERTVVAYGRQGYEQYPGVFSAAHVDYGTRFLLDRWADTPDLQNLPPPARIVDAACGNGILGDQLLRRYPSARLFAYDVSRLAVASARLNLAPHGRRATVELAAELDGEVEPDSVDLVVTNPPFHDGHRNDSGAARELFADAQDCLRAGGHLVVVANRHLNYATYLRRLYTEVLTVAENDKFVVYRARK